MIHDIEPKIDVPMISKFENELCIPTYKVALTLSVRMRVPLNELWTFEEQMVEEKEKPLSESTKLILSIIPTGEDNAITLSDLCLKLGHQSRTVRRMIEHAIKDGAMIVNFQNGKGYFQPETDQEVLRARNQERARALNVLKKVKTYNNYLLERGYWT